MFDNVKLWLGLGIGVALASAAAVSYRHYTSLIDANASLTASVETLRQDVALEKARADVLSRGITTWARAAETQAKALDQLTEAQKQSGAYMEELKDVLSKHNLGELAKRKPGLIESRVNSGSERATRLLEQSTRGAASAGDPAAASGPSAP